MNDTEILRDLLVKKRIIRPRKKTPLLGLPIEAIDAHYRHFLGNLELKQIHFDWLERRGLSSIDISIHGYKSMPFGSGILIPVRNRQSQIIATVARLDGNRQPKYRMVSNSGKSLNDANEFPPHFATLGKPIRRTEISDIVLTSGELRANILSELVDAPVVGLASPSEGRAPDYLAETLLEAFPNLRSIKIAFDAFIAKDKIVRVIQILKKSMVSSSVLTLSGFKSFDALLIANKQQFKQAA